MNNDKYLMDSHKLLWHLDRVKSWQSGTHIPPIHIDVGLSKGCNIRCEYCFGVLQGNFYRKGAKIYFPREPLLQYMRDAGESGVKSMGFIGEGEPLLNPHVYEAIHEAKKSGIDVALGTNGILLDTTEIGINALRDLSWIRFNLSVASKHAYIKIHRSTEFDTVINNIRFAVTTKHNLNLSVTIGIQMVLTPTNVDQVIPLAKLGRGLGVDYLVIKQCSDTVSNQLGIYDHLDEYKNFETVLKQAENLSTPIYSVIPKWQKIQNKGKRTYDQCLGVPFLLYSSGDGKLYPCGAFFDFKSDEYLIGDLTKQSFKEIMQGDRYKEVIEKVKKINVHKDCYSNCRTHFVNEFLWQITHGLAIPEQPKNKPEHVNFI